jgi:hypothetical protein
MVYIGSDEPLPTTGPWNKDDPRFYVAAVSATDVVREHLKTKFVVDARSAFGCACGFCYQSHREVEEQLEGMQDADAQGGKRGAERFNK